MAYRFDDIERQIGATPQRRPQQQIVPAQATPPAPQPQVQAAASVRPHASSRLVAERQVIYGEDAWLNSVPATSPATSGLSVCLPGAGGQSLWLSEQPLSKHLLLLGGIGSGKTNVFNFILSGLMLSQSPNDIIFVFDTKGDFLERFYQPANPNHVVIGNAPSLAGVTRHWNVFAELEEADGSFGRAGEFAAKEIGKQLFEGRESSQQPFFGLAAADLVSKVLIDFERRARGPEGRGILNNAALVDWFARANLGAYTELVGRNPDFANAQLYFGDPGQGTSQKLTAQALGVFAYINLMVNDLLHGIFASHEPGREFSMRQLVRDRGKNGGKTVVFVEYDLATGEVLGPMYRLLFDLALKEALGASRTRGGNVVFVIDEFKLLPNLMHIDDALNFGRSLGVKVLAGLQSINQVFDIYGEDRGRAMLSGFMNAFCFQASDHATRTYVSERFGENVYQLVYRTRDEYQSVQQQGYAVEGWDLRAFEPGKAAIDLLGVPPFVYQFSEYTG